MWWGYVFSGCLLLTSPGKSKRAPGSNLQVCSDLESMSQRNTYIKYWDILLSKSAKCLDFKSIFFIIIIWL